MNERILKLAKQSGFYFYDLHNIDGQDYGETIEADSWNAAEKFAELIVRECCDIFVELRTRPADLAVKDVKKHFGIDE